ncbi:MAG TPA: adenylate/guanylate cyclase domain-containing protein [Chthoniobacterales bacterium]|nr:adenylate/guanylate cyclase domain-containing protein [Chthoniobacterales bacterium]
MSAEAKLDLQPEIAHILLIDVVGYSKLLVNEQVEYLQELNRIVRGTPAFRAAESADKLIRLPTGDGMALLFFQNPQEPAQCALEISHELESRPHLRLRMGIHSGPVSRVLDVNDQYNVAGAGINIAQRVLDCGDAGHILLSRHIADDLAGYRHWQPYLHDLGEFQAKHGLRLRIVNLCKDQFGNPRPPQKLRRLQRWKAGARDKPHAITPPRFVRSALAVAIVLAVLALALGFLLLNRQRDTASQRPASLPSLPIPDKSIAVLPFENLSDDKKNAFFTDGVQDEILNHLAKVADLKVISRTSVMQYKSGAPRNLREIARDLGVAHVVEGTVQRSGDHVRVSAQLIDARTDMHLWAEHYDREVADVFGIQTEIAEQVVTQLKAKLSPEEKAALEERSTHDLAARDLYVRARNLVDAIAFSAGGAESLTEAIRLLNDAVRRDPKFLLAYYHLARAHDIMYFLGFDHSAERLALAEKAVRRALELRPESGEAHLAQAQHFYWGYRDYDRAREELTIARRALPNEPLALVLSGYIDRRQGRWDDSTRELERALELDPRNLFVLQQLSYCYQYQRRFKDLAAVLDRVVAISPNDVTTRVQRAFIDLQWRADTKPLHAAISDAVKQDEKSAGAISDRWIILALSEHDAAGAQRVLQFLGPDGCHDEGIPFPRAWCEGMAAHLGGDQNAARAAFMRGRDEIEKILHEQPNYAEALSVLAMIDAMLGKKNEALEEARRANELLPVNKDALNGARVSDYRAVTTALVGDKKRAIEQLTRAASRPGGINYGELKLHPYFDGLRGTPEFERLVNSLAPKD